MSFFVSEGETTDLISNTRSQSAAIVVSGLVLSLSALSGCQGKKVVAQLGSTSFTQGAYLKRLEAITPADFTQDEALAGVQSDPSLTAGSVALIDMIRETALANLATQKKVPIADSDVEQLLNVQKEMNPSLDKAIRVGVVSEANIRRQIKMQLEITGIGSDGASITPTEIQQFYNQNINAFKLPTLYGIRMVTVPNSTVGIQVLNEVKATGNFQAVVQKYNIPASPPLDGHEQILADSQLKTIAPLYNAITKLTPLQFVPAPVQYKAPGGQTFAIVAQLTRTLPAHTLSLADVTPLIRLQLLHQKFPDYQPHTFQQLNTYLKNEKVVIYPTGLAATVSRYLLAIPPTAPGGVAGGPQGGAPGATGAPSAPPTTVPGATSAAPGGTNLPALP